MTRTNATIKRVRTDLFVIVPDDSTVEEVIRILEERGVPVLGSERHPDGYDIVKHTSVDWTNHE